jgi:chromosome segregation ATPase
MGFFTAGNLLTLGIVVLILILYRQFDRQNRTLDKIHKYADRLKEELAAFVDEKERDVRNYGVTLKVQQDSAKELMKRLQITDEELAEKAAAVSKIDERISAYDSSLEELVRMTGRVQENLNRIRDESSFVEGVHQRISELRGKIDGIESEMETLLPRFERENAESLEKVSEAITAALRSAVSDLGAQAETIERKVEDHREAIDAMERTRAENLDRDINLINSILKEAVEQAGLRADKIEDAALIKLREQAQERVRQLHDAVEEKLKASQESARERILEVQGAIQALRDEWKTEYEDLETKQRDFKEKWIRDVEELRGLAEAQQAARKIEAEAGEAQARQLLAALEASSAEVRQNIARETGLIQERLQTLEGQTGEVSARVAKIIEEEEGRVLAEAENRIEGWKALTAEAETQVRRFFEDVDASLKEARGQSDSERLLLARQIQDLETHAAETAAGLEARFAQTTAETEGRMRGEAEKRLEEWKTALESLETRGKQLLGDFETAAGEAQTRLNGEMGEMKRRSADELGAVEKRLEDLRRRADETAAHIEAELVKTVGDAGGKAQVLADAELEKWKSAAEQAEIQIRRLLADLEAAAAETERRASAEAAGTEKRLKELQTHTGEVFAQLEQQILKAAEDLERKLLEETGNRLEEYRTAQAQDFKRLESLAEDASRLDGELRFSMEAVENRVRADFSRFEQEASRDRESAALAFNSAVNALKADLEGVEQELAALKRRAYENVSEKLDVFEADFAADLSQRSGDIDRRLGEWQEALDAKLSKLTEDAETQRRDIETVLNEEMRKGLSDYNERFSQELDHLKADTGAFDEGIREQMKMADDSLVSFKEQLDEALEEIRSASEAAMKAEVGNYGLTLADTLKQQQREADARLKEITGDVEERSNGINVRMDAFRRDIDEWQSGFSAQLREIDATLEDVRRRNREMVAESDERLAQVRSEIEDVRGESASHRQEIFSRIEEQAKALDSAIKEADRHIKEFNSQTKLFDRADELKVDLEQRIEDLRGDLDRLDQRRSEAAQLEGQFVKIKRLEDEVNFKMTRFLSEKHRIEQMEADFNRLLLTSKAVEEKLVQVSSSDDSLQAVQVQIRRLDDALAAAEEKYQRIEKKNQTLEETNDGIDQNFKALQESEDTLRRFNGDLQRLTGEMETLHASVEGLARENERARETAEKLVFLESSLSAIEERIASMQAAREWLARTETRLEELNKEAQEQVKLMGALLKGSPGPAGSAEKGRGKGAAAEKGALPIGDRENVIKLARLGWTVDEIARSMRISKGEVELILEIGLKD